MNLLAAIIRCSNTFLIVTVIAFFLGSDRTILQNLDDAGQAHPVWLAIFLMFAGAGLIYSLVEDMKEGS